MNDTTIYRINDAHGHLLAAYARRDETRAAVMGFRLCGMAVMVRDGAGNEVLFKELDDQ